MCRKPVLRLVAVLLLGLTLAGPVHAAGPGKVSRVFAAAWDWLQDLWASGDHGCGIDPDGKPRCTP